MSPVGFRRSNWWSHDDVIKMKDFPRYWPFVRGIHRSPMNSAHKVQWRGDLMFSLICAWIKGWVNNREVGDLRRGHAHYDVIVMRWPCVTASWHEHVFHINGALWGESTVVDPHNNSAVMWNFDISSVVSLQNLLNKQPSCQRFETQWSSSDVTAMSKCSREIPQHFNFDGLVQDCSMSIALAMEILQSCTKPSILTSPCTYKVSDRISKFG